MVFISLLLISYRRWTHHTYFLLNFTWYFKDLFSPLSSYTNLFTVFWKAWLNIFTSFTYPICYSNNSTYLTYFQEVRILTQNGQQGYLIYLFGGFYVAFNTVQVISRRGVGQPMARNYQLSHLRPGQEPNLDLRGGRRECYHSATVAPNRVISICGVV